MQKNFFDVFARYKPTEEKRALLERGKNAKFRYVKEPMRVEVELDFDAHEDAELLYEIEDECREFYNAESFRILPHFPATEFNETRFSEIAAEAALCGAVTNGFFTDAEYQTTEECVIIKIPYSRHGIEFVKNANTETILENILKSRYGITKTVIIEESANSAAHEEKWRLRRLEILKNAELESRAEFDRRREETRREREEEARQRDPHYDFEARAGISTETGKNEYINETTVKMGATVYDFSSPELIYGEDFDVFEPTPLSEITSIKSTAVFLGTVFEVSTKETRAGDKLSVMIGISDGASGIYLKRTVLIDEADWVKKLPVGCDFAVFGKLMYDKFDNEPFVSVRGIKSITKTRREDNAEEKRVELHLHTNMSQMDALITPGELIKTAIKWGHKAIAVTDHGNVQAFPEVMLALEKSKSDLKVLYGIEGYYVNDTARCIFGENLPAFDGEMVVFDVETTGLSNRTCKLIEIGAVKIKNGKIIDKMDIFVDPECPIPAEITELTHITDEMVKGAPKEREAISEFLRFAGDDMLIAHNANFDIGFIRVACDRQGFEFKNAYLDTLGLSRYVNPELKNHKLDTLVELYNLGEFQHHRASDDSEVLSRIFIEMLSRLKKEGITDFYRAIDAMGADVDPIKLKAHHIILFAKNKEGLKNLYKLVSMSYLNYYGGFGRARKVPRMPKSVIEQHRDGLIIGSACESGELYQAILEGEKGAELDEIASFYDYLEIQPICN
ncbi:MAG: PHP domain-containing protein, partial [Clostridia bacterium]|nr:PHP domain-containing protein [Clostridia bacterium]